MPYVDFKALKQRVSILDVVQMLDLKMVEHKGNYRCACPTCGGGARTLSVTPAEEVFNCLVVKKGGDCISLAAHVLSVSLREAAIAIDQHFPEQPQARHRALREAQPARPIPTATPPTKATPGPLGEVQTALEKVRSRLVYDHEILGLMGFPEVVWRSLGIGYDPRSKRVMYPLYKDGEWVGYGGLATSEDQSPLMMFHKNLVTLCAAPEAETKPDTGRFLRVVK